MSRARPTKADLLAELETLRKEVDRLAQARGGDLPATLDALRESEERYRTLAENASDLIAEVDTEGRFLFISPNCRAVLGIAAEKLVGSAIHDAQILDNVHSDDRERLVEAFLRVADTSGGGTITYRYRRTDGSWRWFDSKSRAFTTGGGEWRAVVMSRDVTDREEALRRLRQSEERYRMLSDATHDLVAELDAEGRVLFVSPSAREVLGYEPAELVGTTPFSLLHADDVERLAQRFLVRLTASHVPRRDQVFRVRHRDGSWRWLEGGGVNFQTEDGEMRVVSVSRDVTERLRAVDERQKLEDRVQQAQKFESLGVMAAGVAHDFNNLLTPILGDASLALMDLPADSSLRSRLERIQRSAHHAATLTNQLLDYAGAGSLDTESLDLSKLVREMRQLLQSAVSKRAALDFDLAAGLPAVEADAAQLGQVVMNLVTNASEAIEARGDGEGSITIRSGAVEASRQSLSRMLLGESLPEGSYVYLEVEDSGCGMDAATRERIFDPFFTTRFTGRGLGLAAVLGIVRQHGGALRIQSEPGRGTCIRVLCPSARDRTHSGQPPPGDPRTWRATGSVLVADDDDGARELLAETLGRAGFTVICAADGRQAVDLFADHRDEIQLVLLDRTMPVVSGEEALDGIRRIRSDVPVVLVSGYSEASSALRFAGRQLAGVIQKPFLPENLIALVRDVLEN